MTEEDLDGLDLLKALEVERYGREVAEKREEERQEELEDAN